MSNDTLQTLGKFLIAGIVVAGCFVIIYQAKGDPSSAWGLLGLVVGWIVRDSAGAQATSNAVKTIAAATPAAAPLPPPMLGNVP